MDEGQNGLDFLFQGSDDNLIDLFRSVFALL